MEFFLKICKLLCNNTGIITKQKTNTSKRASQADVNEYTIVPNCSTFPILTSTSVESTFCEASYGSKDMIQGFYL